MTTKKLAMTDTFLTNLASPNVGCQLHVRLHPVSRDSIKDDHCVRLDEEVHRGAVVFNQAPIARWPHPGVPK